MNASGAWSLLPGRLDVVVAVADTGADLAHADLALSLWDGNAHHGASFARPAGAWRLLPAGADATTMDEDGHGTLVAGVLGATAANGVGVRGVADAPLMLVKIGGLGAPNRVDALAEAIAWAVDHGARVVCVSQATPVPSPELEAALAHAEARGAVVVAAAGNDGRATRWFPAAYGTVVSVGAVDEADAPWALSSFGKVDLAAPGVGVLTTALGNRHALADGTSVAAPHVAGAAALVVAAAPHLGAAEVRALLNATARDVGPAGRDAATGHGVVDAGAAVALALRS